MAPLFQQPFMSGGFPSMNRAGGAVGGWVELGRATAGAGVDDFSVSSLPDKRYYMILRSVVSQVDPSNYVRSFVRFNGDSGSNYAYRYSFDGANETTVTSNSNGLLLFGNTAVPDFGVGYIANYSSKEKLMIGHGVGQNIAGAGNAPSVRWEMVGKWANTSNAINQIGLHNSDTGSFNTNDELIVLGYDPADTHTTNFWQELADVSWSSGGTIDTGTFTAKKYLWVQAGFKGNSGTYTRFNNDASSNYSWRYSNNGGADATQTSITGIHSNFGFDTNFHCLNMFIINNTSNEKLVISHLISQNTAGAGNTPQRAEGVHKWANTSNQITSIKLQAGAGSYTGGFIKVWGAD